MQYSRRQFIKTSGLAMATASIATPSAFSAARASQGEKRILKSIKVGMFREEISIREKLRILKELGFDGLELNSPGGVDKQEALDASREVGLPLHGVVDSIHWSVRLSDPDPETRERGLAGLITALNDAHRIGGSAVLLVPGKVTDPERENHDQVWERSIQQVSKALPTAARLGIHILIENVWNEFCYDPNGGNQQSADLLAKYIDAFNSPWVGSYFDIGNHQKFGRPAEWIRTLGKRIVKVDVKDWGVSNGFCKIGDGDVDWPGVRKALDEIGFTGWSTAEVSGGDRNRIREVGERMDRYLLGA